MSHKDHHQPSQQESRQLAEASRQAAWEKPSFLRDLFLGKLRLDLVFPFPVQGSERKEFTEFFQRFKQFLLEEVDPIDVEAAGDYPDHLVERLKEIGAFSMKIPKEYGGLGFDQVEYAKIMELLGGFDGNVAALLSAHQSIGVPQPLKLFGTPAQKEKYLPRCAGGEISAFALTEPDVGSDPARLSTTAELTPEGDAYILNGEKLWCTNGTLADLLVVMARDSRTQKISAFVVETRWAGVEVTHHCRFMGLKALSNAVIRFRDVRVPRENLIPPEGKGLKIALTTLNDGRLSIPNGAVGTAKRCLEICRRWANERVQWGAPVGKHEAIAHKIADMAAKTFAMESMVKLATQMSNQGTFDIRLEAAASKEWSTERGWEIVDDMMQVRGGRGYETERSLEERGEEPVGVERMMRDFRVNRIFEGSSEIMHLFMAREAVDKHLEVAGSLVDPKMSAGQKLAAFPRMAAFYAWWYPSRWLGWGRWPRFSSFGSLAGHLRFVERSTRRLARQIFHGMIVHKAALQRKQAFLFRLVDIANELFAMTCSISRARTLAESGHPEAANAQFLTDLFCRRARRKVQGLFHDLWSNDDVAGYRAARRFLEKDQNWISEGVQTLEEALAARKRHSQSVPSPEEERESSIATP